MMKRFLTIIPTIIGVNLIVFFLFFVVNSPNHIAEQALGEKNSTPEQIERWKESHGYNLPYVFNASAPGMQKVTQTILFQKSLKLIWCDFGDSDMTGQPIAAEIWRRIPPTLCLTVPIFLGSLVLNIFLAMLAAASRNSKGDRALQYFCVLSMSVSTILYIIAGQFIFAKVLRLVPVSGFLYKWDMVRFLVLPVFIGILAGMGTNIRFYRTLFLEEMNKDYVRTARAKGLDEYKVLFLHVLKNALIPILTNVPIQLLMLVTGSFLLERFFSIPGMGSYTIMAVTSQDFSIVRAMVFLVSMLYIIGLFLTDICYCLVDPRVKIK